MSATNRYGPVLGELLTIDRLPALDGGSPNDSERVRLQSLSEGLAFAHVRVVDLDNARCCLSAIWLLYDFLDESHTISQGIATPEGCFWHGIMHRREGDYPNAKYWFRKVGPHPVYAQLAAEPSIAAGLSEAEVSNAHDSSTRAWDPCEFVDACQSALRLGGAQADRCQQLQQREWELLFDYCYSQATQPQ